MISILIPTYNYNCSVLVKSLHDQAEELFDTTGEKFEIIVSDDASDDLSVKESCRKACELSHCRFIGHDTNLGRAKNRNEMAKQAEGDWLLFIDCDAEIPDDKFLLRYSEKENENDVICGGIDAPKELPSPEVTLRYKYEYQARKVRTLTFRLENPYIHFSTFNFMIRTSVFMDIMFDEKCREYGYEDALLGLRLKQRGIRIEHIDNPLVHVGMDTNECFINKCEQSMRTLKGLGKDIKQQSHVGSMAYRLKRMHLTGMMTLWHLMFSELELINLRSSHPSLLILKIYKLGYFCKINGTE